MKYIDILARTCEHYRNASIGWETVCILWKDNWTRLSQCIEANETSLPSDCVKRKELN